MSENKSMNDWLKDWDALQRQYFNAWSDLAQKAPFALPLGTPPFAAANPFAAAGDHGGYGGGLGTVANGIGGVLDIAAGIDLAVVSEKGHADVEA